LSEGAHAPAGAGRGSPGLLSIQILRAVAALGVLTHHTAHEVAAQTGRAIPFNELVVGAAGVDLFFVISGFVMVYASDPLFGRAGAPRVFFLRRLARIAPLYWATTAILLVYVYAMYRLFPPPYISTEGVIASFLFLPYPLPNGLMGPVHALGWTLNYEMFFYAVFAAALRLPRRGAVCAIVALFAALVAIGRLVALPQPLAFWCDPLILEFCFGMLVALAYREGVRVHRAASIALLLAALAAYGAIAAFGLSVPWRPLAWGLPGAALVAALALARDAPAPGPAARAFGYLGDASYSLYLVHVLVFPIVRRLLSPWFDLPLMPWVYALALVAASIVAAILSYRAFEQPITRALQKRIGGMRPARLDFGATRTVKG
jgi:exopolysaccharide production protein ExoZ